MAARRRFVPDIPRTLAVASAFTAVLLGAAWQSEITDRFDAQEIAVLAAFAAGFVALTLACDAELRASVRGWLALRKAAAKSPGANRAAT